MPSISIALATYNGAGFIEEQLASFVKQELRSDELVVTDDGSTDGTVDIVARFAADAPFAVRIERNSERLGYTGNFERAISLTTGDLILISDQDDAWYPEKIRIVAGTIQESAHPLVTVNDQNIVDAERRGGGMTTFGNLRRAGAPDSAFMHGSCMAFPRSLLPILAPFPDGLPYDSWIGAVADALGIKVLIPKPLQIFRRHGNNSSNPLVVYGRPTQWAAFRQYGMNDPRAGWASEIAWRSEMIERLQRHGERIPDLGIQRSERAIGVNKRRINALRARTRLLDLPRWQRTAAVLKSWRSGLYAEFLGAKSAIKDAIR